MFSICSRMRWTHLPNAGGVYDQDPELLRCWRVIWEAQDVQQKADEAKRKREAERNQPQRRGASRPRR